MAPDITFLIEESNGFSLLDTPRAYFEGDSTLRFPWSLSGARASSILDPGGPAVSPPFSALSNLTLASQTPLDRRQGLDFGLVSADLDLLRLTVSGVSGDMGGFLPMGKSLLVPHPASRSPEMHDPRRKLLGNTVVDGAWQKRWRHSALLAAAGYFDAARQFNDFNERNATFEENGKALSLLTRYSLDLASGSRGATAAFTRTDRDRFMAEQGRLPQETLRRERSGLFASLDFRGKTAAASLHFLSESDRRTPNRPGFAKELFDLDGEGLLPFERFGRFSAGRIGWQLSRSFALPLAGTTVNVYFDGERSWLSGDERIAQANPVTAAGAPYLVLLWTPGASYRNQALAMRAGLSWQTPIGHGNSFVGKVQLRREALNFSTPGNDIGFWRPDFDLGLRLGSGRKTEFLFSYGRSGQELGPDLQLFLERDRPAAEWRRWDDADGDGLFQAAEAGESLGFSGGPYHEAGSGLSQPEAERLLVSLTSRISANFRLDVKGLYKRLRDRFWVDFAGDYGSFESVGDRTLYVLDRPVSGFRLVNADHDKDPFYAQLSLRYHGGRPEKWYFSLSFMAHIGMGYTAFGNGPLAGDVGAIDETQANPNSILHGYGRLDGDRAFVGKIYFGRTLLPRLFLSGTVRYRDGTPFAFLNAFRVRGQWLIVYADIKAENEFGKKGGPREDCLWDFNFKLSYFFRLFGQKAALELSAFNLLDIGSELSENVWATSGRPANELQLARSIRLGVSVGF